jgi:hypothetical protein
MLHNLHCKQELSTQISGPFFNAGINIFQPRYSYYSTTSEDPYMHFFFSYCLIYSLYFLALLILLFLTLFSIFLVVLLNLPLYLILLNFLCLLLLSILFIPL